MKGFRVDTITVVTTLLDPERFPTSAFADLYRRRWNAELFLRDIKTTMGMDILRCKTPEMVHKELTIYLIAYNLVRLTMLEAAHETQRPGRAPLLQGDPLHHPILGSDVRRRAKTAPPRPLEGLARLPRRRLAYPIAPTASNPAHANAAPKTTSSSTSPADSSRKSTIETNTRKC